MSEIQVHQSTLFPEHAHESTQSSSDAMGLLHFKKTIRVAVTGDVLLTATEVAVIDACTFQRLRGVRQLGTVNFVYPTALHTRFDHSLGTLAKADEMVLAIAKNAKSGSDERGITMEQRLLARMYALIHDVPHIPFGHTIEDELHILQRHDENPARIAHFLGPNSEIAKIVKEMESEEFYNRLLCVYLWEDDMEKRMARDTDPSWNALRPWLKMRHDEAFIHDIVSNTVCADLLDYLARDNYFCNLGISLEYRFLNYLYLKFVDIEDTDQSTSSKRRVFVRLWKGKANSPRRDLLTDLTRLMEARYMLAERAYFHHAKLATGAMLGRALQEFRTSNKDETYYYGKSDDAVLEDIRHWEQKNGRTDEDSQLPIALASLLRERRLHRTIETYGDAAFEQAQDAYHRTAFKAEALERLQDPDSRRDVENRLAAEIDRRPGSVLVYAPPTKMNRKIASVNVHWKGNDMTLSEIDDPVVKPRLETLIKSHESLWAIRLLATRDLDDEEIRMVKESFELEFLIPDDEQEPRRLAYLDQVVQKRLLKQKLNFEHGRYHEAVRSASSALSKAARSRDFNKRLSAAVEDVAKQLARQA